MSRGKRSRRRKQAANRVELRAALVDPNKKSALIGPKLYKTFGMTTDSFGWWATWEILLGGVQATVAHGVLVGLQALRTWLPAALGPDLPLSPNSGTMAVLKLLQDWVPAGLFTLAAVNTLAHAVRRVIREHLGKEDRSA